MAKEISKKKRVRASKKKKEESPELGETDYAALSALLDFYSDRAVAHASFVVACVFGLFTVLSLLRGADLFLKVAYSSTYWVLWSAGMYSLLNFRDFAIKADRVKSFVEKYKQSLFTRIREETKEVEIVKRPNVVNRYILKQFLKFKANRGERKIGTIIFLYIVFIGILPWSITFILQL